MQISRKNIYFATIFLFMFFLVIELGIKQRSNLKENFVFDAIRLQEGIYLYKKGIATFVTNIGSFPKWSPKGKIISCIRSNKIFLYDIKNKKITKTIRVYDANNCQILPLAWATDATFLIIPVRVLRGYFFDFELIKYNLDTNEQEVLLKFEKQNALFNIKNLHLDNNNKVLAFSAGSYLESSDLSLYLFDLTTKNLARIFQNGNPIGWITGEKKLLLIAFYDNDIDDYTRKLGSLIRLDIETGTLDVIENFGRLDFDNINLSRDGQYLYYSKRINKTGSQIMITKLGESMIENEKRITKSFFVNDEIGYSKDMEPDWLY